MLYVMLLASGRPADMEDTGTAAHDPATFNRGDKAAQAKKANAGVKVAQAKNAKKRKKRWDAKVVCGTCGKETSEANGVKWRVACEHSSVDDIMCSKCLKAAGFPTYVQINKS